MSQNPFDVTEELMVEWLKDLHISNRFRRLIAALRAARKEAEELRAVIEMIPHEAKEVQTGTAATNIPSVWLGFNPTNEPGEVTSSPEGSGYTLHPEYQEGAAGTVDSTKRICPDCKGGGGFRGINAPCPTCKGEGEVEG